ncbi:hypothetical protein CI238_10860 [Colletotrichum incanum]|uniref:Uncharacterized protein n=1 Tax=Colletotrichum incanum TaxID=1573173 RepID=A0A162PK16_COLIC|nr:hypothetical protein CI238_10860 [Colletotrichum incanum]
MDLVRWRLPLLFQIEISGGGYKWPRFDASSNAVEDAVMPIGRLPSANSDGNGNGIYRRVALQAAYILNILWPRTRSEKLDAQDSVQQRRRLTRRRPWIQADLAHMSIPVAGIGIAILAALVVGFDSGRLPAGGLGNGQIRNHLIEDTFCAARFASY